MQVIWLICFLTDAHGEFTTQLHMQMQLYAYRRLVPSEISYLPPWRHIVQLNASNCLNPTLRRSWHRHKDSKNLKNMKNIQQFCLGLFDVSVIYTRNVLRPWKWPLSKSPPHLPLCQSLVYHSVSQIYVSFWIKLAGKLTYAKQLSAHSCQLYHPCLSPFPFPQTFHFTVDDISFHLLAMYKIFQ